MPSYSQVAGRVRDWLALPLIIRVIVTLDRSIGSCTSFLMAKSNDAMGWPVSPSLNTPTNS